MEQFEFRHYPALLLLVPYAAAALFFFLRKINSRGAAAALSSRSILGERKSFRTLTYPYLPFLRFISILLLIIALAGPGRSLTYSNAKNTGLDIMIALDLSLSMQGEDFEPRNRLEVAKRAVSDFIAKRANDRLGLVIFAGEAYLQCPLTVEHDILLELVDEINFDTIGVDGTAIGDALALSASRMMNNDSKSRIILLITDGVNNRGTIDPSTAAKSCRELGIKIYSIGIGKEGQVPYPGGFFGKRYMLNSFDPSVLREASEITGGRFFRAESSGVFWENINEIDTLEKSVVNVKTYRDFRSKSSGFIIAAMLVFFTEMLLRSLVYRKAP
ncbi:MAG: VWA domain-containing protein [Spirochaetia bacterium]|jgi:Ca-activated chloride channel family protein|nr:VWA domain-containing protein [Spirochaetia bacterium]